MVAHFPKILANVRKPSVKRTVFENRLQISVWQKHSIKSSLYIDLNNIMYQVLIYILPPNERLIAKYLPSNFHFHLIVI